MQLSLSSEAIVLERPYLYRQFGMVFQGWLYSYLLFVAWSNRGSRLACTFKGPLTSITTTRSTAFKTLGEHNNNFWNNYFTVTETGYWSSFRAFREELQYPVSAMVKLHVI